MPEEDMPITEHERKKGKLPILVIVIGAGGADRVWPDRDPPRGLLSSGERSGEGG